jgi:hypothetical protein
MSRKPGPVETSRREILAAGAGVLALIVARPARATPESMATAIKAFVGETEVREGRVTLEIPPRGKWQLRTPDRKGRQPNDRTRLREDDRHLQ